MIMLAPADDHVNTPTSNHDALAEARALRAALVEELAGFAPSRHAEAAYTDRVEALAQVDRRIARLAR